MQNQEYELQKKIINLKQKLNAVLIVHNYQREEIQNIADYIGDSLYLSRVAAQTKANIIVFCGVHFMAETASILSPDKIVLLPEKDAGCPLSDMISADDVRKLKKEHPKAKVICYVNSSAEVKAETDICCTSANAVQVVQSLPKDEEIIFIPDKNLGFYVSQVTGRKLILWDGFCPTHHRLLPEDIDYIKMVHPKASIWSHPECSPEVLALSDRILSTGGMCKIAATCQEDEIVIATEMGIISRLKKDYPDKKFYLASEKLICPNMKLTTLESIFESLEKMKYIIKVPENIRIKALKSITKMLEIG